MCSPEPGACHRRARPVRQASRGVTLIELLASMTLGLLVILAAVGTLVVARGASASVGDISQLQQQASYALRVIGLQLRQAGAIDPAMDAATQLFSFASTYTGYGATFAAVHGSDDVQGARLSTSTTVAPLLPNTQNRDCIGNRPTTDKIEATFWLEKGELRCAPTPSTVQSLIQNVAGFQVNYRVLNGADSQVLNAKQVEAAQLWASVKAVEICLDMQGTEKMPDAGSSYPDCQGVPRLRNGFVHLVYRNVFDLRVAGPLE